MGRMIEISKKKHLNKRPDRINSQKESHDVLLHYKLYKSIKFILDSKNFDAIRELYMATLVSIQTIKETEARQDFERRFQKLEVEYYGLKQFNKERKEYERGKQ